MTRILLLCLLATATTYSQVGIGTTNPDNSSILDIVSTEGGVLIPRLTEQQKIDIVSPATGLLIYQIDAVEGFWYHDGTNWIKLEQNDRNWNLNGNSNISPGTDFIGTIDNEDLVIKTNDTERMRIHNNSGNISINSTIDQAKLYVNRTAFESTVYGIRNESTVGGGGTKYGFYNRSTGNVNGGKYGIYNYLSGGSGLRYGIYNQVTMSNSPSNAIYGIRNNLNSNGLGVQYGQYNNLHFSNNLTADAYGQFTHMDYSAGDRYGAYRRLLSINSVSGGIIYGDYNRIYGSGNDIAYGSYNALEITGNAPQFGTLNRLNSTGTGVQYGTYNTLNGDNNGTKYGSYNNFQSPNVDGNQFGIYNLLTSPANFTDTKYGIYNQFGSAQFASPSESYGLYNNYSNVNSNGIIYGTYTEIGNSGTGWSYGIYADVQGGNEAYAAYFNAGNVVSNPLGGDYDFKVGTQSRPNALFVDASTDVVKIGADLPAFADEGVTVGGTAIDYVASFYNGQSDGTTVGIGQNVYLLEGDFRLKINAPVVAAYHLTHDLGYSTTEDAWDDVYADDFVNISDQREKEDIEEISYGLNEIMSLSPVKYTLKKDPFKEPKLGLLAQQVLTQVKEAVKTHDYKSSKETPNQFEKVELERYGLKYDYLIPVLIKAMQEQQEQIVELKERIESLEKKN